MISPIKNAESVLSKKAVLTVLTISQWSARRFDKKLTNDVHASHGMQDDAGRYNKQLLAKDALEKITHIHNKARGYNWSKTLPWMDMDGQRLLPAVAYIEYTNEMRKLKDEFTSAVKEFVTAYPTYVEAAKKRLNGAFDPADYPEQGQISHRFYFDVAVMPCPSSDFRCDIASEQLADIEADVQKRLAAGLHDAQKFALEKAATLVGTMVDRLRAYKPATEKGEKTEGRLYGSLVDNIREFVPVLRTFNFADDPVINTLADKMEKDLCAFDAPELRESDNAREKVADAAEKILKDVTKFMA